MLSLNIAEAGFGYIFKCIGTYYEGNIYFLLYILSLVFLSLAGCERPGFLHRGSLADKKTAQRMREIFLPQFIMMAVTVYNPVFPVVLNSFFDVNKEYYRFLWMSPVIICIAAAGAITVCDFAGIEKISSKRENENDRVGCGDSTSSEAKRRARTFVAAVFIICLLTAGGSFLYKDGYIVSPNVYHMPTEIPEISEIIHEDAGEGFPRAMFEYDYQMQIRQYDAGILLACDREQYMRALAGEVSYETATEDGNYIDCLLAVAALGIKIPEEDLISSLEHTGTEYFVMSTESGMVPYLEEAGLTVVGETANHTVMHYEPEDAEEFELPDYSEVWRLTPQWYDFLL